MTAFRRTQRGWERAGSNYSNGTKRKRRRWVLTAAICTTLIVALPLTAQTSREPVMAAMVPIFNLLFEDESTSLSDRDEDGVPDNQDTFPDDPDESQDSDGDGLGDNADPRPYTAERLTILNVEAGIASVSLAWFSRFQNECRVLYGPVGARPSELRTSENDVVIAGISDSGLHSVLVECYDALGNSVFSSPLELEVL